MKSLIERNKRQSESQTQLGINVPLLIFSADKKTQVDFTISSDRYVQRIKKFISVLTNNTHLFMSEKSI